MRLHRFSTFVLFVVLFVCALVLATASAAATSATSAQSTTTAKQQAATNVATASAVDNTGILNEQTICAEGGILQQIPIARTGLATGTRFRLPERPFFEIGHVPLHDY